MLQLIKKTLCLSVSLCLYVEISVAQTDTSLQRALQAHQSGDLETAVKEYTTFLKTHPTHYDIRSNLGAAYSGLGRYNEAIIQYKHALKSNPHNPSIKLNLAMAYYKSGHITSAYKELELLISSKLSQKVNHKNVILLLADCYLTLGEYQKVEELLEPLAQLEQNDLTVAYLLGTALVRNGKDKKGQIYIDKILGKGDSAEGRLMIATMHIMLNDYATAVKELEAAYALNPKLPAINGYLGKTYRMRGEMEKAQQAFQRELEINPNDFDSNLQLGMLLKDYHKNDDAINFLNKALIVRPGEPNAGLFIAGIELAQGKIDQARIRLEEITTKAPDFVEAHIMLATAYYRLKRKADGDRHQAIVSKLNSERQAKQPGAQ